MADSQSDLYKKLLFTEEHLNGRIAEMAATIVSKYDSATTLFVSLLNGAQPFTAKLMFAIQKHDPRFHPNAQAMIVSRYGPSREPGELHVVTDLPPDYRDLKGYSIVLLDDLIDGGETLSYAKQHLLNYGAKNVDCVVLVQKVRERTVADLNVMYGFEVPNKWITGMGMDDTKIAPEANRWANWIAIAND